MSQSRDASLAILGGRPAIKRKFQIHNTYGREEIRAAKKVIKSGVLSKFLGSASPDFFGGPRVLELERIAEQTFGTKHAIAVNSWTSGLVAAVGAIGIEPGDEVIVTPWTMSATVAAILHWSAIPIFVDIDPISYNLDPLKIHASISPRTKAIMVADIFGMSANVDAIMKIAHDHSLKVISDTAQSPGATYKDSVAGTIAHIGGISLNYHKHIHTGEGGILFTNDDELALRLKLIRNHAESVVEGMQINNLQNMIGYNFRLGEIEAALAIEQIKKLPRILKRKIRSANLLTVELAEIPSLRIPNVEKGSSHVYYVYPIALDSNELGISRKTLVAALRAEGIPALVEGYQNIHLLPLFEKKIAFGAKGFPWSLNENSNFSYQYHRGMCPVAEELHDRSFIGIGLTGLDLRDTDIKAIGFAFKKVWRHLHELREIDSRTI